MRRAYLFIAAMLLILLMAGCEENPVDEYGTGLVDTYKSSEKAGDAATLKLLQQSIQMSYSLNGKYPASIEEVAASMATPVDVTKYDYDPESGKISLQN